MRTNRNAGWAWSREPGPNGHPVKLIEYQKYNSADELKKSSFAIGWEGVFVVHPDFQSGNTRSVSLSTRADEIVVRSTVRCTGWFMGRRGVSVRPLHPWFAGAISRFHP